MRAHGESSSSWNDYTQTAVGLDLVALIRELNAGPAVLVGHSYSAGSVIWTAAHAPLLVAGIASMAGFIRDKPVGLMARSASMLMARSASAWSLHYNYAHRTTKPADLPAWRKGLVEMLGEPSRKKAFATMVLGSTREGERWAPAVNCPVLVIMGKKDPDFRDPTNEAALQGRLLSAEVVLIEGAGHYPHSEFPDRVAAALLPFLHMTLSTQLDAYQPPRKSPL
jgi:pimeloyl-ACP methyl ester carboxylesterase